MYLENIYCFSSFLANYVLEISEVEYGVGYFTVIDMHEMIGKRDVSELVLYC